MDPQQISAYAEIIEQYGLGAVSFIILMVFCIQLMKKTFAKDNTPKADLGYKAKVFVETLRVDSEVGNVLNEALGKLACTSATLWQFHNGISSVGGVPFLKVSATHQATGPCVAPYAQNYRDIPLSLFSGATEILFKDSPSWIATEKCQDTAIKSILANLGMYGSYFKAIKDAHGTPIALLTVSYAERPQRSAEVEDVIDGYGHRVGYLLGSIARTNKAH